MHHTLPAWEGAVLVVFVSVLIGVPLFLGTRQVFKRANHILDQWCGENSFSLISRRVAHNPFNRGPFAWGSPWHRPVYRVSVRDPSGRFLEGWVKLGGFFTGILSDEVVVAWDHEAAGINEAKKAGVRHA